MESINKVISIPQEIYKEIRWCLFNYKDIEKEITKRKNKLYRDEIDYYHFTNKNSLKNISSYGSTLENCIISVDEDWKILRYKKWKKLISDYLEDIENEDNYFDYMIIEDVFFEKRSLLFEAKKLNLTQKELLHEIFMIIYEIYQRAINRGLYKEVSVGVRM